MLYANDDTDSDKNATENIQRVIVAKIQFINNNCDKISKDSDNNNDDAMITRNDS